MTNVSCPDDLMPAHTCLSLCMQSFMYLRDFYQGEIHPEERPLVPMVCGNAYLTSVAVLLALHGGHYFSASTCTVAWMGNLSKHACQACVLIHIVPARCIIVQCNTSCYSMLHRTPMMCLHKRLSMSFSCFLVCRGGQVRAARQTSCHSSVISHHGG